MENKCFLSLTLFLNHHINLFASPSIEADPLEPLATLYFFHIIRMQFIQCAAWTGIQRILTKNHLIPTIMASYSILAPFAQLDHYAMDIRCKTIDKFFRIPMPCRYRKLWCRECHVWQTFYEDIESLPMTTDFEQYELPTFGKCVDDF